MRRIEGCAVPSLRLDWDNAETVYIEQLDDGRFRVYDRYETLADLRNNSDTYLSPEKFGFEHIRRICLVHGLQLTDLFPSELESEAERNFAIVGYAQDADVTKTAAKLADAIDEIFAEAERAKNQRTMR